MQDTGKGFVQGVIIDGGKVKIERHLLVFRSGVQQSICHTFVYLTKIFLGDQTLVDVTPRTTRQQTNFVIVLNFFRFVHKDF